MEVIASRVVPLLTLVEDLLKVFDCFLTVLRDMDPVCESNVIELEQNGLLAHKLVVNDEDGALVPSHIYLPVVVQELDQRVDLAWNRFLPAVLENLVHRLLRPIHGDCGALKLHYESFSQ